MIAENMEAQPSLFELAEQAEAKLEAAEKEKKSHGKGLPTMGTRHKSPSKDKLQSYLTDLATGSRQDSGYLTGRVQEQSEDAAPTDDDESPASPEDGEASRLYTRFPQFFAKDGVGLEIPAGWQDFAEKAFAAFWESGLKLTVKEFGQEDGALTAAVASESREGYRRRSSQMGERLLNALLRGTRELCPLCGSRVEPKAAPEADDGDGFSISREITGSFAICRDCLTKHGLSEPEDVGETR